MNRKHLSAYLNDHLAGSMMAIAMLEHLEKVFPSVAHFAAELLDEIEADKRSLEQLMQQFNISQGAPRKASAWMGEKLIQLKIHMDDRANGSFGLFEATEALSLGIEGKRSLWLALEKIPEMLAQSHGIDFQQLIRRAEEQRGKTEAMRLLAAQTAFSANSAKK